MTGYWYPTDPEWLEYLSQLGPLDEVNFWQPRGRSSIGRLERGAPFFFKLTRPHNHVAGFGFFDRQLEVSVELAWEAFGPANGAADFDAMVRRIEGHRKLGEHDPSAPYLIGCLMIQEPVFFRREDWIPPPSSWKVQGAIKGAGIDMASAEHRELWSRCVVARARSHPTTERARLPIAGDSGEVLRRVIPRRGQGAFKLALLDAYGHACAVTGEHSEPVLDAAHIRDYAEERTYEVPNGLLLRTDIHRLFDKGYVTVTPDYEFRVSPRLEALWKNGKTYYELAERVGRIHVPPAPEDRPDRTLLERHFSERFLR